MSAATSALFLASPSPGRIYQFLRRRAGVTPERAERLAALDLRLSDPAGPQGLRALVAGPNANSADTLAFFQNAAGPLLSEAFAPAVTLVYAAHPSRWGYRVWPHATNPELSETLEQDETVPAPPPLWSPKRYLSNVPASADDAARLWARSRGLPIERVPGFGAPRGLAEVEYVSVAGLDQRGLLVETTPRLYRFAW